MSRLAVAVALALAAPPAAYLALTRTVRDVPVPAGSLLAETPLAYRDAFAARAALRVPPGAPAPTPDEALLRAARAFYTMPAFAPERVVLAALGERAVGKGAARRDAEIQGMAFAPGERVLTWEVVARRPGEALLRWPAGADRDVGLSGVTYFAARVVGREDGAGAAEVELTFGSGLDRPAGGFAEAAHRAYARVLLAGLAAHLD